mgnify:CR=1 FL=1
MWKVPFKYPSRISLYSRGEMGVSTPPPVSPVRAEVRISTFRVAKHSSMPMASKNRWREGEAGTRTMALVPPLAEEVVGDLQAAARAWPLPCM